MTNVCFAAVLWQIVLSLMALLVNVLALTAILRRNNTLLGWFNESLAPI